MEHIADRRARIGMREFSVSRDAFPEMLSDQEAPARRDVGEARGRSANTPEAGQSPPAKKQISILQAERRAKIVVLTTALATWAYFSQDVISLPELILSVKRSPEAGKPAATSIFTADHLPDARP